MMTSPSHARLLISIHRQRSKLMVWIAWDYYETIHFDRKKRCVGYLGYPFYSFTICRSETFVAQTHPWFEPDRHAIDVYWCLWFIGKDIICCEVFGIPLQGE